MALLSLSPIIPPLISKYVFIILFALTEYHPLFYISWITIFSKANSSSPPLKSAIKIYTNCSLHPSFVTQALIYLTSFVAFFVVYLKKKKPHCRWHLLLISITLKSNNKHSHKNTAGPELLNAFMNSLRLDYHDFVMPQSHRLVTSSSYHLKFYC